jgi:ribosomal protein L34
LKSRDLHTYQPKPGVRGKITGFSKRSRTNLLRLVSRLRADVPSIFITLTYRQLMLDHVSAKAHLDLYLRWLKRRFPRSAILWRMEYQRRGAIHFHLIVFGATHLPARDATAFWQRITGDDSYPDIRLVTGSKKQLMAYVSKYIAKVEPGLDNVSNSEIWTGRFWGVHNRRYLPFAPLVERSIISVRFFWSFRRVVRRYLRRFPGLSSFLSRGSPLGFSVFCDSGQWLRLFDQMVGYHYDF